MSMFKLKFTENWCINTDLKKLSNGAEFLIGRPLGKAWTTNKDDHEKHITEQTKAIRT